MNATAAPPLNLLRIPVDKPAAAVNFLRARGGGVMDLIAHFWERLPQTPPLARNDLHLLAATNAEIPDPAKLDESQISGVMLYVPKAYRADVLAPTLGVAETFARYILHVGSPANANPQATPDLATIPQIPPAPARCAIDFLTGAADGLSAMIPHLLPAVHKKAPARLLVNIMMQLPATVAATPDPAVRPARDSDLPALNRWRRLYKEERGILFDADMDAWVESQKVFVLEHENQIAAAAKFDLELSSLIEIGGVYTFPEFRNHGFAQRILVDLAARIRAVGKTPTLQVDQTNSPAVDLYQKTGWVTLGRLARAWLTAS